MHKKHPLLDTYGSIFLSDQNLHTIIYVTFLCTQFIVLPPCFQTHELYSIEIRIDPIIFYNEA